VLPGFAEQCADCTSNHNYFLLHTGHLRQSLKISPGGPLQAKSQAGKEKCELENVEMNKIFLRFCAALHRLQSSEQGQDLVEYSLLICLVALGSIAGVRHVATAVTAVFSNVSSSLA